MLQYKIDVLATLKEKGYTTYILRRDKLLSEGVIQSLRKGKVVSAENLDRLCALLKMQPGSIIKYVPDEKSGP